MLDMKILLFKKNFYLVTDSFPSFCFLLVLSVLLTHNQKINNVLAPLITTSRKHVNIKRNIKSRSWKQRRKRIAKSWLWIYRIFDQRSSIKKNSISYHPLTNFETQKYYQNKPKFNGVYSRII